MAHPFSLLPSPSTAFPNQVPQNHCHWPSSSAQAILFPCRLFSLGICVAVTVAAPQLWWQLWWAAGRAGAVLGLAQQRSPGWRSKAEPRPALGLPSAARRGDQTQPGAQQLSTPTWLTRACQLLWQNCMFQHSTTHPGCSSEQPQSHRWAPTKGWGTPAAVDKRRPNLKDVLEPYPQHESQGTERPLSTGTNFTQCWSKASVIADATFLHWVFHECLPHRRWAGSNPVVPESCFGHTEGLMLMFFLILRKKGHMAVFQLEKKGSEGTHPHPWDQGLKPIIKSFPH